MPGRSGLPRFATTISVLVGRVVRDDPCRGPRVSRGHSPPTGVPAKLEEKRRARLDAANAWKAFKSSSLSSFAFVDSMGLFFARNLFRDAFSGKPDRSNPYESAGLEETENGTRLPRLTSRVDGAPLGVQERCDIAANFLRTMGLTREFARLVLLVGHGSETKNNAHAAGINCGACGGQPGDVNARAAAALLNDAEVRAGLVVARHRGPGDDVLRRRPSQHDDRRSNALRGGHRRHHTSDRPHRAAGRARPGERRDEARACSAARSRRSKEGQRRVRQTLTEVGAKLDPSRFVRVHRGELVRVDAVVRYEPGARGDGILTLSDGTAVVLSRSFRREFSERFRGGPMK